MARRKRHLVVCLDHAKAEFELDGKGAIMTEVELIKFRSFSAQCSKRTKSQHVFCGCLDLYIVAQQNLNIPDLIESSRYLTTSPYCKIQGEMMYHATDLHHVFLVIEHTDVVVLSQPVSPASQKLPST